MTVWWISDVDTRDINRVGGKAGNLGRLARAGFPVPPGFVVDIEEYEETLQLCEGVEEFDELLLQIGDTAADQKQLAGPCRRLQEIIHDVGMTVTVRAEVRRFLGELNRTPLAVRSSATAEDASDTSFAGVHASFTNVGADELEARIVDCWASSFSPRAVAYRLAQNITERPKMAVIVQSMVDADCSGVAFTINPATGSKDEAVVEAAFGLGESVVGGDIEPDTYVIRKSDSSLIRIHIGNKTHKIVRRQGQEQKIELSPDERDQRVLGDATLRSLVKMVFEVETEYGREQDIEWAVSRDTISLLQARPITRIGHLVAEGGARSTDGQTMTRGLGASFGLGSGPVRVVDSPHEADQVRDGEVLVAPMTAPDWLPAIRRASALVTDQGGMTCHAAIVARELGLPCVVGTRTATSTLHDGDTVTVDGETGAIHEGALTTRARVSTPQTGQPNDSETPVLATHIYVNLAMADQAAKVAALPVDGVGLLRAELLLHDALHGQHPGRVLAWNKQAEATEALVASILQISQPFVPRPVVYRTADFRSNEFRNLSGGDKYEPNEHNPMLGYRGCYRYVRDSNLFDIELDALARVREQTANVHIMLPFVRTRWELEQCLDKIDRSPLGSSPGLHRWIMAEVPSVAYWLPEYVGLGIDGVSIGSNDLTQLILGVDRDSEICAPLFNEHDPAVLDAISTIIASARNAGIRSSLCGQAPSEDPQFADFLVQNGISSISVNPDAVPRVRRSVGVAEQRIMLESARHSVRPSSTKSGE